MHRLLILTLASACSTSSSTDVLTSEIYAAISAEATGDGTTTVTTTLFVDSPITLNYVHLEGGDSLVVKSTTQSKPMAARINLNTVVHHAELDGDAEGMSYEVIFTRDVDAGAPRSVALLPAKFELATPPSTMSRATPLTITWSPSASVDGMSWRATGDCIETANGAITGDPGTVTVEANRLVKRMGQNVADQCPVTVTVQRVKPGFLDEHYRAGNVYGTQSRSFVVTATP